MFICKSQNWSTHNSTPFTLCKIQNIARVRNCFEIKIWRSLKLWWLYLGRHGVGHHSYSSVFLSVSKVTYTYHLSYTKTLRTIFSGGPVDSGERGVSHSSHHFHLTQNLKSHFKFRVAVSAPLSRVGMELTGSAKNTQTAKKTSILTIFPI